MATPWGKALISRWEKHYDRKYTQQYEFSGDLNDMRIDNIDPQFVRDLMRKVKYYEDQERQQALSVSRRLQHLIKIAKE